MGYEDQPTVVVVDNNELVCETIASLLKLHGFGVLTAPGAREALELIEREPVDVVLSDVVMPGMTGIDLLDRMGKLRKEIPVILMTAYADVDVAVKALKKGAFDFILKPYEGTHLVHSLRKSVEYRRMTQREREYTKLLEKTVAVRTRELAEALDTVSRLSEEVVERLTAVAEYKDFAMGMHISRIGEYARKIAEGMGLPDEFVDTLGFASPMHDIGKIAIPDHIILKPGPHSPQEAEIVKQHTVIGERMLAGSAHAKIQAGATIALTHHERYDGSGYPRGLRGEDIPLEGRIVIICDQYDALRSPRPYKEPLSHEETVRIILEGDGRTRPEHFDPLVLLTFQDIASCFEDIFASAVRHGEEQPSGKRRLPASIVPEGKG